MKSIDYLITGSNGLLGQNIVNLLLKTNASFLAVSKGENRNPELIGNYVSLDLTTEEEIQELSSKFSPKYIINTAALTNVDLCEDEKELCDVLNVRAVESLLSWAETSQSKLVHLSTDFIFDGENGPYEEEDKPNPLSYYGKSKLDSERVLLESNYKNWSILRTIIVYGVVPNMSRSNIVIWAIGALLKGDEMNIVNDQFRSPTYAEDLALACLAVCEKDEKGIFHVSGPEVYSIYDFVKSIADVLNVSSDMVKAISSTTLNQKAHRPPKTGFSNQKAKERLDYNPRGLDVTIPIIRKKLKL